MIRAISILFFFASVLGGCVTTEEGTSGARDSGTRDARPSPSFGQVLAPDAVAVRTVQLHRGRDESTLPIFMMGSGEQLRLAFDLLEDSGRSLTVHFYHADKSWHRDLSPSEALTSFNRDQVTDVQYSFGTSRPYVHYSYDFPNNSIQFEVSGNYVIRVSEQGYEEDVVLERMFFVSEQSTPVDMQLDQVNVSGRAFNSIRPIARFRPPSPNANTFDYEVCFVRNERFNDARCSDAPLLDVQPDLAFRLDAGQAFGTMVPDYTLDLSELRRGARITDFDTATNPWQVLLEPDYARFSGGTGFNPGLRGQSVIAGAVQSVARPSVSAEYIRTTFRFEPLGNQPVSGRISVIGSFSDWRPFPGSDMAWNAETGRYELDLLIKQGIHEYRYDIEDPELRRVVESGAPRLDERVTSFVYFRDVSLQTDRLVSVAVVGTR